MTGQETRNILDRAGVFPSKQLGQNFLTDPHTAHWIVSQLEITPTDTIVEVGPGTGALTEHLLGKAKHIILIEFDARLAAALTQRFRGNESVEVHHADAAKFDRRLLFKHRPVKFLGNLPYSSGGAIMKNLLSRPHPFSRAVIMLQKEVIDRLSAGPGTKAYGILSLRIQVNWLVQPSRIIPPDAFYPRPTIDSAVAILTPRPTSHTPTFDARLFDELIRRGFAQRRKQLRKQLPPSPSWETIAPTLSLSLTTRGEELDLPQWISLTRAYDPHPLHQNPQNDLEIFDVVDSSDHPIRTATRVEVHRENLIHRAVHIFVINKNGDLYLQKRSLQKDKNPGLWDSSVSGHLDAGEDYLTAATRELAEEIGIHSPLQESLIPSHTLPPSAETGWEHIHLFTTRHTGPITWPAAEIDSIMPFPLAEIFAWVKARPEDFSPPFILLLTAHFSTPLRP